MVIGTWGEDQIATDAGAAYLFHTETGALLREFRKPSPQAYDYFGSVAVAGDQIVFGAPGDKANDAGGVYVYRWDGPRQATTSADGSYCFGVLDPGTYMVRDVPRLGWEQVPAGPDHDRFETVEPGIAEVVAAIDFGNLAASGVVQGRLFNDLDKDGALDASELGIPDWTVYLDLSGDGYLDSGEPVAVTAPDGTYQFTDLPPRDYVVRETSRDGWTQTTPTRDAAPGRLQ